jgi:murein DD-endopeptidase MepM/ murein hydrolase activator NlpD
VDKEYFDILIFGHKTSGIRHLKIRRKTIRNGLYLLGFAVLLATFFFCDYVQVRKKASELTTLREEARTQKSQIHFFSGRIEDLESQLSKLREFDKKIRIMANLERNQDTMVFVGMGGPFSNLREKLDSEKDDRALLQQMKTDVERLQGEASSREASLSEVHHLLESKREALLHTPSIWPIPGWVTSGFGFRINPFTGLNQMHEAIDISNRIGTPVIAPSDGIVSDIGSESGYGKIIILSHSFGITTRFGHLSKTCVKVGQKVKRGDKIAEVGNTGQSTGPHLHYEVRLNGIPANPMRYIMN